MNFFNSLLPYFNILMGTFLTLLGFKLYKPFAEEKAEETHKKYGTLFKLAGLAMLFYGIISLLVDLKVIYSVNFRKS